MEQADRFDGDVPVEREAMKMRNLLGKKKCLLTVVFLAATSVALAQSDEETFQQFQFNFSTPGARASAMGRAFVGLADDASAAVTNPAGLVLLTKPQFYFEYKHTELRSRRLALDDSLSSLETTTFYANLDQFSFFNFTYPVSEKVSLAFTRHEFLNYEEEFILGARDIPETTFLFLPVQGSRDFQGVSYAGSAAFSLHDTFSLGLTISVDRLKAKTARNLLPFAGEGARFNTSIDDEDTKVGFTLGGLYRPSGSFSLGATYSRGSKFNVQEDLVIFPGVFDIPGTMNIPFNVPDRVAVGFSGRPHNRLLFVFDVTYIKYSDLVPDDFVVNQNFLNESFNRFVEENFPGAPLAEIFFDWNADDYAIDNAIETHFGGEWNFVSRRRVQSFLRGGVFTNPDHSLRFVGETNTGQPIDDLAQRAQFNTLPDDNQIGWTFGGGVTLGQHFQADAAYLSIDPFDELVLSVAIRLP